jgi:hypothetical protein
MIERKISSWIGFPSLAVFLLGPIFPLRTEITLNETV